MKTHDFEQYSPEWWALRLGKPTASKFDKIITTRAEPSKQKQKYLQQLAGEYVCGKAEQTYQNAAMLRGLEVESEAREFYEFKKDVEIKQVGFCVSDDETHGASPDGLVGDKGLIEIKCPLITTHVGYLIKNTLVTDYFQQVQGQMFVTGRDWTDLLSYYPGLRPVLIRVERDEEFIMNLRVELRMFCEELNEVINKIK